MDSGARMVIAKAKAKKPPSLAKPQSIVTIRVYRGSESELEGIPEVFNIHKDRLCFHSAYFNAAFNGSSIESSTNSMNIYNTSPTTFGHLINWIYHEKLIQEMKGAMNWNHDTFANIWLLAQRFGIPVLQNAAVDEIIKMASAHPWIGPALKLAYEAESDCGPVKRALVACAASMVYISAASKLKIPRNAWKDMFLYTKARLISLQAGEILAPLKASDYYISVGNEEFKIC